MPYKRGKTWWISFTAADGTYVRRSAGTEDYAAAKAIEQEHRGAAWRQKELGVDPPRTFEEVMIEYLGNAKTAQKSFETTQYRVKSLQRHFTGRLMNELSGKDIHADSGSAARFFYCAKTSRADRNEGLTDPGPQFKQGTTLRQGENTNTTGNNHPTVKPTDLMAYLLRLVTPPGGVALDPFMGSGSTGKAAMREGFQFIGCEIDEQYAAIARARIDHEVTRQQELQVESDQLDLFGTA